MTQIMSDVFDVVLFNKYLVEKKIITQKNNLK
jgi:hypothetical protein